MVQKLVTIKEFGSPVEAHMFKARLEENGIQAFVNNEMMPLWLGPFGTGSFSIQLQVLESDVEAAMKVMKGELPACADGTADRPEETDTPDDQTPQPDDNQEK